MVTEMVLHEGPLYLSRFMCCFFFHVANRSDCHRNPQADKPSPIPPFKTLRNGIAMVKIWVAGGSNMASTVAAIWPLDTADGYPGRGVTNSWPHLQGMVETSSEAQRLKGAGEHNLRFGMAMVLG